MPTGCDGRLSQADAVGYEFVPGAKKELNWLPENIPIHLEDMSPKEYACGQLALDKWNAHCSRTDARFEWHPIGEKPIETAPDLGPDGVCWVKMPTGCELGLAQADAVGYEFVPGADFELNWLAETLPQHLEDRSPKEYACGQIAIDAWNNHCQRTDARVEWHIEGE